MAKTLYEVLEVSRYAGAEAIHAAHERLAARYSPDAPGNAGNPDADFQLKLVREAFATLGDPDRRRLYNQSLAQRDAEIAIADDELSRRPLHPFMKILWRAGVAFALLGALVWYRHVQSVEQARFVEGRMRAVEDVERAMSEGPRQSPEEIAAQQELRRREREEETRRRQQEQDRYEAQTALSEANQRIQERQYLEEQRKAEEQQRIQMQVREMERKAEAERAEAEQRARQEQADRERKLREIEAERERMRMQAVR